VRQGNFEKFSLEIRFFGAPRPEAGAASSMNRHDLAILAAVS
jgi:hypothetical protein